MITDIVEVFGVLCSFMVVNRIGRRPLLLSTTVLMAIVLLICGGLGTIPAESRSKSVNSAIASMIIIYVLYVTTAPPVHIPTHLFSSIFNLAWGPLAWVVATELASGKNRTKIMGISTAAFWVSAWAVTFTLPYLYNSEPGSAGLGPMVGFICKVSHNCIPSYFLTGLFRRWWYYYRLHLCIFLHSGDTRYAIVPLAYSRDINRSY